MAADAEFSKYDFSNAAIEDANGWEHTVPGREYSRTLYFKNMDNPDGDTVRGNFVVVFGGDDSSAIQMSYASINGNDAGYRGVENGDTPSHGGMTPS